MLILKSSRPKLLSALITGLLILVFSGCAPKAKITVLSPAEIETRGIKTVAIGSFEIGYIQESVQVERNGEWKTRTVPLTKRQKQAIARQIRAKIVNVLGATPYFSLVYTDEFAKLNNDEELQKLVSAGGYSTKNVDAVINGKVWIDLLKTDGSDIAKAEMQYIQGGGENSLNLSVEKMLWWPYKSMRGHLSLEIKMTQLDPTKVIAVNLDTRTFGHRIGGKPAGLMDSLMSASSSVTALVAQNSKAIENSAAVFPSFTQLISDLSTSIATNFVRRVAVTEKMVDYTIATGGDEQSKLLITAGAYEMAIDRLQEITAGEKNPEDLYNLGLSFEAVGEFGLAAVSYKEALLTNKENLMYAQGLGRIERILREHPKLSAQMSEKK